MPTSTPRSAHTNHWRYHPNIHSFLVFVKRSMDWGSCSTLFLLCCLLGFQYHIASASHQRWSSNNVTEEQESSLASFKYLVSADPIGALASWNSSIDLCSWRGVRCGRWSPRQVVALEMKSCQLVGRISPALANLSSLRRLDLSNNQFHGVIPPELSYLRELQVLDLSENSLQGTIPAAFGGCTGLRIFSVAKNFLIGEIPPEIGSLKNLAQLNLGDNGLSGIIPQSISNLSAMMFLRFSRNSLSGTIPSFLGNLSNLQYIVLPYNSLQGGVPSSLGRLSRLSFLALGNNRLSGTVPATIWNISSLVTVGMEQNYNLSGRIPQNIGYSIPQLEKLVLFFNQFHGPIPASLGNASNLNDMDLYNNQFSGIIPPEIGSLQKLKRLVIFGNMLEVHKQEHWKFMTALKNCTNLYHLLIGDNRISLPLPASIANLSTSLLTLYLGDNEISGNIPPGIGNLINLQNLNVPNCKLTGILPSSLGKLQNLVTLDMSNNHFSGQLPPSLGNLTRVLYVYLDSNAFNGSIPNALGKMESLQDLNISHNQFVGTIPLEVVSVATLSISLDVSHNLLEGSIPIDVGGLINLVEFHAESNKLSGEVPESFGNCQLLQYLYLQSNALQGSIPLSFSGLKGLKIFDLSNNNLSGQIPLFLEDFRDLRYLNLSFNHFVGPMPTAGVFSNASAVAIQGNKGVCGGIVELKLPHCFSPKALTNRKHKILVIAVAVPLAIATLGLACYMVLLIVRRQKDKSTRNSTIPSIAGHATISYSELTRATDNFAATNLIGVGSFGSVYKGQLDGDGGTSYAAIKVLNIQMPGAMRSFATECQAMRNLRHRNLTKIITVCSSIDQKGDEFKAIVFEYMPNGSLHDWLYPNQFSNEAVPKCLDLLQRVNIAMDVALAIDYLHHHGAVPTIHCDIKPSNILLDEDIVAHVTDFGIARILAEENSSTQGSASSARYRGTIGYIAPEYATGNRVTTQGDIYSYGILLLEIFTSKQPTSSMFGNGLSLRQYVKMALPDRVLEVLDTLLVDELEELEGIIQTRKTECAIAMLSLGLQCTEEVALNRPTTKDIVGELQGIQQLLAG